MAQLSHRDASRQALVLDHRRQMAGFAPYSGERVWPQASVSAWSSPAARANTRTVMLLTLGFSMLSFSPASRRFRRGLRRLADLRRLCCFRCGLRGLALPSLFALFVAVFAICSSLCCWSSVWIFRRPVVRQGRAGAFDKRLDRVGEMHFGDVVVAARDAQLCACISTSAWVNPPAARSGRTQARSAGRADPRSRSNP